VALNIKNKNKIKSSNDLVRKYIKIQKHLPRSVQVIRCENCLVVRAGL